MSVEIEFEFENGTVKMGVKGAKGKECLDITKDFEKVLGVVKERKVKPEYYESNVSIKQQIKRS